MTPLTLTGLDAANPLAFLAALGCLEALADAAPPVSLHFVDHDAWRPVLTTASMTRDAVVQSLMADAQACRHSLALGLEYDGKRDLKPPPPVLRALALEVQAQATAATRRDADWLTSFADQGVTDGKGVSIKPSYLHFTAGQQLWLDMVHKLLEALTLADLDRALFGPWTQQRPTPVMGWDSAASREFALRAFDPSKDKKLGEPGADWLAVRGWTALRSIGVAGRLRTTGCAGGWKTGGSFRWPLWTGAIGRDVARCVLDRDWPAVSAAERAARGVAVVFSSDITRTDQGGYGSFAPARVV